MKNEEEKKIVDPKDFIPVVSKIEQQEMGIPYKGWHQVIYSLKKNKVALLCQLLLFFLVLISLAAPLSPYNPDSLDLQYTFEAPSRDHWLGTDELGRDSFTRALYGGRVSLGIGLSSMVIAVIVGTFLGTISGYFGGWLDSIIMRLVDMFLSVPSMLLIIVTYAFIAPTLLTLVMMLAFFSWPSVARIVRAETMTLVKREFIVAAKALGVKDSVIIIKHIIPNLYSTIIVSATLSIARAILDESALSFLGYGVQLPKATWGSMLQSSQEYIMDTPLLAFVPGILILLTVLCFNIIGDALQVSLNPKLNH